MKTRLAVIIAVLLFIGTVQIATSAEFLNLPYGAASNVGGNDQHAASGAFNGIGFTSATSQDLNGFGATYQNMNVLLVVTLQSATECSNIQMLNCANATLTATAVATPSTTGVCQNVYLRTTDSTEASSNGCYRAKWTNATTGEFSESLIPNSATTSPLDGTAVTTTGASTATWAAGSYTTTSPNTLVVTTAGVDTAQSTTSFTLGGDSLFALIQGKAFSATFGNFGRYSGWSSRNVMPASFVVPAHSIIGNTSASHYLTATFGIKSLYPSQFANPSATFSDATHCGSSTGGAGSVVQSGVDNSFLITMGHNNGTSVTVCPVVLGQTCTNNWSCGESSAASTGTPFQSIQMVGSTTGVTMTAASDMKDTAFRVNCTCY